VLRHLDGVARGPERERREGRLLEERSVHRLARAVERDRSVGPQAALLEAPAALAVDLVARAAVWAFAAGGIRQDHVVPRGEVRDGGPDPFDHAGALVPVDRGPPQRTEPNPSGTVGPG